MKCQALFYLKNNNRRMSSATVFITSSYSVDKNSRRYVCLFFLFCSELGQAISCEPSSKEMLDIHVYQTLFSEQNFPLIAPPPSPPFRKEDRYFQVKEISLVGISLP